MHFKTCQRSLNIHCKDVAVRSKSKMMEQPDTFVHYEFDYDVDRGKCINNLNMTHYKKKITMKCLNMIQHPGDEKGERNIYAWSGMIG